YGRAPRSAAEADPANAATAVRASTNFFISNPQFPVRLTDSASADSQNPVSGLYAVQPKMLLRGEHTQPKTKDRERPERRHIPAPSRPKKPEITRKRPIMPEFTRPAGRRWRIPPCRR